MVFTAIPALMGVIMKSHSMDKPINAVHGSVR